MSPTRPRYQVAVVGAGMVGLATARAISRRWPGNIAVLETETTVARHQTGHNSGVIHSGLYYKPGSLKARTCTVGREALYRFCAEQGIAHERCGKLVVATSASEIDRLRGLEKRGRANGLRGLRWILAERITEFEPHATGLAALHVPDTGIVDYTAVATRLAALLRERGVDILTGHRVVGCHPERGMLTVQTEAGDIESEYLVNCAGLYSDRVARSSGLSPGLRIVPFRGEYHVVVPQRRHLVRNLIYPVPDPRFPFLGVHFTRTVDGPVEAGPNAVLALGREGYGWTSISLRDLAELLTYAGFWRVARKYWRTGAGEIWRSVNAHSLVGALQKLVPEIGLDDLRPGTAGVRAQAVEPSGALVDDFRVVRSERMVHVLNAPSPAATAALTIGERIADMLDAIVS